MVHLIVAKGPDDAMGSDHAPNVLRNVLSHFGAEILVIQLRRTWAARGLRRAASWLRTQRDVF